VQLGADVGGRVEGLAVERADDGLAAGVFVAVALLVVEST